MDFDARVYSLHEALSGIPTRRDAFDLTKSEGWPWIHQRPKGHVDRTWMFARDKEGTRIVYEPLMERITQRIALAKQKIIIAGSLYVGLLKDEKLAQRKIDAVKTRMYFAAPVDRLIVMIMYFGAFLEFFEKISDKFMHFIGVDALSPTWTLIMENLVKGDKEPTLFDGDVQGWDKVLLGCIMEPAINGINAWYQKFDKHWKEEDDIVRRTLFEEIINTWALVVDCVILLNAGVPSGDLLTATLNTLLNKILMMCFFIMTIHTGTHEDFRQAIRLVAMGDDHVVRIAKSWQQWLNGNVFKSWMEQHGIKYTPADKLSDDFTFKTIEQVEFVKMFTRVLKDGTMVAIPLAACVDNGLQYLRAKANAQEVLLGNLVAGFSYSIFWRGEETYNAYYEAIKKRFEENEIL